MFCCKFVVIFRNFPCNNALLWVGNIMTPETNIPMMPRTGLLLGNVNGSQCIIWDDPAIQAKREISGFSIWKAGKNVTFQNSNDIQSCSFYMRGIYQVFCKLQGIITWTYGTCSWIYWSWRLLWKFHEIPKDALHLSHVFVFVLAFAHQCFRCISIIFFMISFPSFVSKSFFL